MEAKRLIGRKNPVTGHIDIEVWIQEPGANQRSLIPSVNKFVYSKDSLMDNLGLEAQTQTVVNDGIYPLNPK